MRKCGSAHHHHQQQQNRQQNQQQQVAHICPPVLCHSVARAAAAGNASIAKPWPIKLALLLCCICSLLSACSGQPSASISAAGGGDSLTNNPNGALSPAGNPFDGEDLITSETTFASFEQVDPNLIPHSSSSSSSNLIAAQILPQLVQRYLREMDTTGSAAYAVPSRTSGGSGSGGSGSGSTVFKSVPYPIAQLLLARLRSGGLRGAAEVSAEPMLALTPIRKQRGNQLKMANRFGKRDRLRMSNRFGRR